jgi:hypothetical protein
MDGLRGREPAVSVPAPDLAGYDRLLTRLREAA